MNLSYVSFALCFLFATAAVDDGQNKPHVLFFLADDYGWANLGYHRRDADMSASEEQGKAEVHTPSIDALIDEGILLDRHYTYKICSPTRASIQSGRLAVHVNAFNAGVTSQNYDDPVSGFAGIPRNMTGLANKMREAGYRTHMVGKWDAGMATPDHTPKGRGYETWVGYYQHANDYWRKNTVLLATGTVDACLNRMMDFSMHNDTYTGGVRDAASLSGACLNDEEADPACYEEHIFKERVLEIIRHHDASKKDEPLFLFYSFHLIHTPLQVPRSWLEKIDKLVLEAGGQPFSSSNRRLYAAMVLYMDAAIGEAVQALRLKNMYENTLIIFTSDNGGPIYEPGAANNHPLQGGKYSDWEGGVRTNAFVSGGFVPKHKRGSKFEGVINVADWYGTLLELAGVDQTDHRARKANEWLKAKGLPLLPPVDSVPQWGFILNGTNGRMGPVHLSENAVLIWPFKLITGSQVYSTWTGPVYPNCSTVHSLHNHAGPIPAQQDVKIFGEELKITATEEELNQQTWTKDCSAGCLMNVDEDPTEHEDLASNPAYAELLKSMQDTLHELNKDLFKPDRGTDRLESCQVAMSQGRVFGPFVDADEYYSDSPARSPLERASDLLLEASLKVVNQDFVKFGIVKAANAIMPTVAPHMTGDTCIKPELKSNDKPIEHGVLAFTV